MARGMGQIHWRPNLEKGCGGRANDTGQLGWGRKREDEGKDGRLTGYDKPIDRFD